MSKDLGYLSSEVRLRELELLNLEKGRLRKILSMCVNTRWRAGSKGNRATLFSLVPSERTGGSGNKLIYREFY